jgi:hypothetical protein
MSTGASVVSADYPNNTDALITAAHAQGLPVIPVDGGRRADDGVA